MFLEQVDPHVHTALLILRIVLATTIIIHGYTKFFGSNGIQGTAQWFEKTGMRPGLLHARLAGISEIGFGYLLAFGFVSSFAAGGIVALMFVACLVAHRGKGFLIFNDGWEYTAIIATIAVTISMIGPGRYSLDYAIGIDGIFDGWYGLAISAGGGVLAGSAVLAAFYNPPTTEETAAASGEDAGEHSPEEEPTDGKGHEGEHDAEKADSTKSGNKQTA